MRICLNGKFASFGFLYFDFLRIAFSEQFLSGQEEGNLNVVVPVHGDFLNQMGKDHFLRIHRGVIEFLCPTTDVFIFSGKEGGFLAFMLLLTGTFIKLYLCSFQSLCIFADELVQKVLVKDAFSGDYLQYFLMKSHLLFFKSGNLCLCRFDTGAALCSNPLLCLLLPYAVNRASDIVEVAMNDPDSWI